MRRALSEDQSALNRAATTGTGSEKGYTPLICAVRGNQLHVVRFLVVEAQANVNVGTLSQATPLYIAAFEGHLEVVKLLVVEAQADVNKATIDDGITPVMIVTWKGFTFIRHTTMRGCRICVSLPIETYPRMKNLRSIMDRKNKQRSDGNVYGFFF